MTQGQSGYTRFKYARFAPVLAQSLRISKAVPVARFPYYHIDLNAGSGFNDDAGVDGSPLNFLDAVRRTGRDNFYAFFVDHTLECIAQLGGRPEIEAHPTRVFLHHADNAEVLPVVSQFIADHERNPRFAVGSIVIDPNGYHGGVPWEPLRTFCAAHPRIDIFINLNLRSWTLERACVEQGRKGFNWPLHPLSTFPAWFSRAQWMWTDRTVIHRTPWIQGVGRTMCTRDAGYSSLGFYDSKSERGRAILAGIEPAPADRESALLF